MDIKRIINRRIRHSGDGVDVVGDVNAVVAANVNEDGGSTHVSSKQHVVQRDGKTVVSRQSTGKGGTDG